jgi:hypothetical protein
MEIVKNAAGVGDLFHNESLLGQVRYALSIFQQTLGPGGFPVPGLERLEGSIDLGRDINVQPLVGHELALKLDDGRVLALVLTDAAGRVASSAPALQRRGCSCC